MSTDKLTAETITDDQIQKLKVEAAAAGNIEMYDICGLAFHPGQGRPCGPLPTDVAYKARQRCADIINAVRAQEDRITGPGPGRDPSSGRMPG